MKKVLVLQAGIKKSEGDQLPKYSQSYPFVDGLRERGVDVEVADITKTSLDYAGRVPRGWLSTYASLIGVVRSLGNYDAVVSWSTTGALLSLAKKFLEIFLPSLRRCKIVVVVFSNSVQHHSIFVRCLGNVIIKFGLRNADAVIYMTHRQMEEARNLLGVDLRIMHLVSAGVDTEFFKPLSSRESHEPPREEFTEFSGIAYVVVGGDQLRSEQQIIDVLNDTGIGLIRLTQNKLTESFWKHAALGKRVRFPFACVSNLSPREVRYAYRHALYCLNLVDNSWQPAGWSVATEAMACGLPVIINEGLIAEEMRRHLGDDQLPLIMVETVEDARRAIIALASDRAHSAQLGKLGRDFVEINFNVNAGADAIARIIHEL